MVRAEMVRRMVGVVGLSFVVGCGQAEPTAGTGSQPRAGTSAAGNPGVGAVAATPVVGPDPAPLLLEARAESLKIERPSQVVTNLARVAHFQDLAGDRAAAVATLDEALKYARGNADQAVRERVLPELAGLAIQLGNDPLGESLRAEATSTDDPAKASDRADQVRVSVVRMLTMFRNYAAAEMHAEGIQEAAARSQAFLRIAIAQVKAGNLENAERLLDRITTPEEKLAVLREIACRQFRQGGAEAARETLSRARELVVASNIKAEVGTELARAQVRAGDMAGARETLRLAELPDEPFDIWDLAACASSQVAANRLDDARATVEMMRGRARTEVDPREKAYHLYALVESEARVGDFAKATATAESIADRHMKVDAYCDLAKLQARAGQKEGARESLARAARLVEPLDQKTSEAGWLLERVMVAQVLAGEIDAALAAARKVEGVYGPDLRVEVLVHAAAVGLKARGKPLPAELLEIDE